MTVVLLAPQLGVHLQADVLEVDIASNVLHVTLSNVVTRLLRPVARVQLTRQLLPVTGINANQR